MLYEKLNGNYSRTYFDIFFFEVKVFGAKVVKSLWRQVLFIWRFKKFNSIDNLGTVQKVKMQKMPNFINCHSELFYKY